MGRLGPSSKRGDSAMESPFFQAEAIKGGPNPPCGTGGIQAAFFSWS